MREAASSGALPKRCTAMLNLMRIRYIEECHLPDHKQEDSFRVIDRRPFTAEGELRKEVVEQEERDAAREAAAEATTAARKSAQAPGPVPVANDSESAIVDADAEEAIAAPVDAPSRIPAF